MESSDKTKEYKYGFIIWHFEYIKNHNFMFDNYIYEPLSNYQDADKIRIAVITDVILKDKYKGNYFYAYKLIKDFCNHFEYRFGGNIIICTHLLSSKFIDKAKFNRFSSFESMYSLFTLMRMVYYKANFYVYDIITRCGECVCIYNNEIYNKVYNSYRISISARQLSAKEREINNDLLDPNKI